MGGFPEPLSTGAGFAHCVEYALPGGCSLMLVFCSFRHRSHALIPPAHSWLLCPAWGKKAFSGHIKLLSGGHLWSGFPYVASRCTQPVQREHWAAPWLIHPGPGRGLGGKKATVSTRIQPALG